MSLTTTAIFTFSSPPSLPSYTFSTPEPQSIRPSAINSAPQLPNNHPRIFRSLSDNAGLGLKEGQQESRASSRTHNSAEEGGTAIRISHHRRTWLRRLSMSSSRESSRPPTSRSVSQSNGSVAYSNAGSTTPIFSSTAGPLPPNKLVKRSSSIHDVRTSPSSKLPLPTFRRPATSHQRSSMNLERHANSTPAAHTTEDEISDRSRDPQWRLFFTSKIAQDELNVQRRHSSSIPNPIKRVYPDRRYRPSLVSGRETVSRGEVEYDDGFSSAGSSLLDVNATSSPIANSNMEQAQTPKRSFSIGDLLSTGPQPLWRSASRSKAARRNRRRISSPSHSDMGSMISVTDDTERPSKRRGLDVPPRGLYSSSSALTGHSGSTTPQDLQADAQQSDVFTDPSSSSSAEQRRVPTQSKQQTRLSGATSELTSGGDSDSELRSFGDTNTDYQSDSVFDSVPTRTTRSISGRRGPPIDTIFDETPPPPSSGRSTKLKDYLSQDSLIADSSHRYSTIEEEESVSTPVRSLRDRDTTSSPTATRGSRTVFSSSPPMREMVDPDDIDWDAPDDIRDVTAAVASHSITPSQQRLPLRFASATRLFPADSTPQRGLNGLTDKATIFDWSEAQPSPSHDASPPRPRTVHGKKDENRNSRPAGRRPVSGMHARSHSVPVVPDVEGKRNTAANKFGTWGVGSKAVTEDWNEDFDFDADTAAESSTAAEKRIDSGHAIMVPQAIREQQISVVANIGLLREWGLLIEELKELRRHAAALDILNGKYFKEWKEVDAMIELADQETEEHTLEPRRSPPSSPGFDFSAFEEVSDLPGLGHAPVIRLPEPVVPQSPPPSINVEPFTPTRPRKDSEAVARSVIETLRERRTVSEGLQPVPAARKVPFDTGTLRHIVPYVKRLKRKVKDALRETEGLYKSPSSSRHAIHDEDDEDDEAEEGGFDDDDDGAWD